MLFEENHTIKHQVIAHELFQYGTSPYLKIIGFQRDMNAFAHGGTNSTTMTPNNTFQQKMCLRVRATADIEDSTS